LNFEEKKQKNAKNVRIVLFHMSLNH